MTQRLVSKVKDYQETNVRFPFKSKKEETHSIGEVVNQIAIGDRCAEKRICEMFLNRYTNYFLKQGYPKAAIEDAVQEALISLIDVLRRDGLDNPSAVSGYFVNTIKYQLWQNNRKSAKFSELNEWSDYLPHESDCFERVSLQKELENVIYAIESLRQERDKEILIRRFIEAQSIEEICSDFEIDKSHFYRVLYRARNRLSKLVA